MRYSDSNTVQRVLRNACFPKDKEQKTVQIQENPRAHINKIGTRTPHLKPKIPAPNGHGGFFPAERTERSQAPMKLVALELQVKNCTDTLKALTSLSKASRPFFLGDSTFGVFPLFLPLAIAAFGGPEGYFSLAIIALWSI